MKTQNMTIIAKNLFLIGALTLSIIIHPAMAQQKNDNSDRMNVKVTDYPNQITQEKMVKDLDAVTDRKIIYSRVSLITEALNDLPATNSNFTSQRKEYTKYLVQLLKADLKLINKQLAERNSNTNGQQEKDLKAEELNSDKQVITQAIEKINNNPGEKINLVYADSDAQ